MRKPSLAGFKVLELGGYLAAPFCGRVLTQLGADVIKVEAPGGDPSRHLTSPATFITLNVGKRSLCLDLKSSEGRQIFERLLAGADALVHNLAPDATRKLRLTADDCRDINPAVIYCQVSGYGPGPLEEDLATNPAIEASTGVMFNNRLEGRPIRLGLPYYDMAAGSLAAIGILAARASSPDDAEGRTIRVPLYETGLYLAAAQLVTDQIRRSDTPRPGQTEFSMPGYGAYKTADERWIYLIMLSDGSWRLFCRAMSLDENGQTPLPTGAERLAEKAHVEQLVSNTVRDLTFDAASARLQAVGFGFEEVRPPSTVLEHRQASSEGKMVAVSYHDRSYAMPAFPILGAVAAQESNGVSPPAIGEHSIEVVKELGYDSAHAERLRAQGVIYVAAPT